MDDLIQELIDEAQESLAKIEPQLVHLQNGSMDEETTYNIFRLMHTVKGTSAFLNLSKLETIARSAERVVNKVREEGNEPTKAQTEAIFKSIHAVRTVLDNVAHTGQEPLEDFSDLIDELNANVEESVEPAEHEKIMAYEEYTGDNLLEGLTTLVPELVSTRNQFLQLLPGKMESEINAPIQRLNHIISNLQEAVKEARTVQNSQDEVQPTFAMKPYVLMVDDSPFFRRLVLPIMEGEGFEVVTATGAEEAFKILRHEGAYDIIISDIDMPKINGYELAKQLKKEEKLKDIPLIAVSLQDASEGVEYGISQGFDFYLETFDVVHFRKILSDALKLRQKLAV